MTVRETLSAAVHAAASKAGAFGPDGINLNPEMGTAGGADFADGQTLAALVARTRLGASVERLEHSQILESA